MKFVLNSTALKSALTRAIKFSDLKSKTPEHKSVYFSSDGERLSINTCHKDGRYSEVVAFPGLDVFESNLIDVKKFLDGVKAIPKDTTVSFDFINGELLASSSFGVIPLVNNGTSYKVDRKIVDAKCGLSIVSSTFFNLLDRIKYAQGIGDIRYYLNGVIFKIEENGTVDILATDGHRLALQTLNLDAYSNGECQFTIPSKTILGLLACRNKKEIDVLKFEADTSFVNISYGNISIRSVIHEGGVKYERVIPSKDGMVSNVVDVDALICALDIAKAITVDSGVKFESSFGELSVYSVSQDGDNKVSSLDGTCKLNNVDPTYAYVNVQYLLDVLNTMKKSKVDICIKDGTSPILIQDVEHSECLNILMPKRRK